MTSHDFPDIGELTERAADSLVDAMATEAWTLVRDKLARVVGLEQRMDADHARISQMGASEQDRTRLKAAWQTRIDDAVDGSAARAQQLRAAMQDVGPFDNRSYYVQRVDRIAEGGRAIQVSGQNNVVADRIHQDKRSYRFGLGRILPVIRQHWVVSTVVAVLVVGGGGTAAAVVGHGHASASSPPKSLAVIGVISTVPALAAKCATALKATGKVSTAADLQFCDSDPSDDSDESPATVAVAKQATAVCRQLKPTSPPAPEALADPSFASLTSWSDGAAGQMWQIGCTWGTSDPGDEELYLSVTRYSTADVMRQLEPTAGGVRQADGTVVGTSVQPDPATDYEYYINYPDLWTIDMDSDIAPADATNNPSGGPIMTSPWSEAFPAVAEALKQLITAT